jgi:hypothetical protein
MSKTTYSDTPAYEFVTSGVCICNISKDNRQAIDKLRERLERIETPNGARIPTILKDWLTAVALTVPSPKAPAVCCVPFGGAPYPFPPTGSLC